MFNSVATSLKYSGVLAIIVISLALGAFALDFVSSEELSEILAKALVLLALYSGASVAIACVVGKTPEKKE